MSNFPKRAGRTAVPRSMTLSAATEGFPVVGVGASAGGLDACKNLLRALPGTPGMALILVQHLDPTHESMMADLLAAHTSMVVRQAADDVPIERDHLYIIPPGFYLSVRAGRLRLTAPVAPHGARLPFDFLLKSLAAEYGDRAIGVILSGTGTDGSDGLKAVREHGGFTIAQDPTEAGYGGMPRNAIATGAVDLVLPVEQIPQALATRGAHGANVTGSPTLARIVDLLRARTAFDFKLYKPGTLQRRTERRMALASIGIDQMERYLDLLESSPAELDLLAQDLLINVTGFFRDPKVFGYLAEKIIPDLVRDHPPGRPLRIWVPGCSTGEEAYSLAMLFLEAIAADKRTIRLQVFASDVDPDAVARAREGFYPRTIEGDLTPERMERFFSKDVQGFRIAPDLRAAVVFTVQNLLADPPFSRLDLISCRNVLIYLNPEAQAKIVSLFHFALVERGLLLLGTSEEVSGADSRFEMVSKPIRLYRHVGPGRPSDLRFSLGAVDSLNTSPRPAPHPPSSHQNALAELCRRLILEHYAPAAVLINRKLECLYYLGPTDAYLRLASGQPVHDLLSMAREGVRTKLRAAIQRAIQSRARTCVDGASATRDGKPFTFSIVVHPVESEGEELLLVCFLDGPPAGAQAPARPLTARDRGRVAELERELEVTRAELESAIRNLEISSEEQKAVNEEALSVNEEFQSTNEELLASKEELQSLNEELTALNGQLQETLERQRTTSSDLQNVLYSTDVATLFLDTELKIRFFTPATRHLFSVIPGDVGRPLSDLSSLADDGTLMDDIRSVLTGRAPIEREVEARNGAWYLRRILPYRTQGEGVDGVVITFVDVTERRRTADALEAARREAELANTAKSRFLAAASHDLRQPLQSLVLLQGLLAKAVTGEKAERLVVRLDETVSAMSGMLNALLDINQIEAGTLRAEVASFPINDLLDRLRQELTYHAQAKRLRLRVIPCSLSVESDPRLLEQMVRNLISNALKYTERGHVLVGCRRHGPGLRIEVWDTGVGIPVEEHQAIFNEYHQLHNAARDRNLGLGLGLAIVQRLGTLLGHPIQVRSHPGRGSVFSVEVKLAAAAEAGPQGEPAVPAATPAGQKAAILVIEDDPDVRALLQLLLTSEGHLVTAATDGAAALELVERGAIRPDLILADYNLPNGMTGLEASARLRTQLRSDIPVVVITGDISTGTLREIAARDCVQLTKPVKAGELTSEVQRLLTASLPAVDAPAGASPAAARRPVIFIVDDDDNIRQGMRAVLEEAGHKVEDFESCEAFLDAYRAGPEGCLLVDATLPGMTGLELLQRLQDGGHRLPAIMVTGHSDVRMAVQAMKAGAFDFIEKPVARRELVGSVERALQQARDQGQPAGWRAAAVAQLASLTGRQRQILDLVLAGHPSKNIAADLGISQRTVENHRAAIMKKTGAKSLPGLARIVFASSDGSRDPTS
ncbi:chemotaxis protein CheB [Xanthobacter sp. KR7-225]|uniref:chemotaxis protein CheB n=1 Tax=Xanthobacter sp. KR7-225 TaxID=3156613 RepID=UPI0032B395F9